MTYPTKPCVAGLPIIHTYRLHAQAPSTRLTCHLTRLTCHLFLSHSHVISFSLTHMSSLSLSLTCHLFLSHSHVISFSLTLSLPPPTPPSGGTSESRKGPERGGSSSGRRGCRITRGCRRRRRCRARRRKPRRLYTVCIASSSSIM